MESVLGLLRPQNERNISSSVVSFSDYRIPHGERYGSVTGQVLQANSPEKSAGSRGQENEKTPEKCNPDWDKFAACRYVHFGGLGVLTMASMASLTV